MMLKRRDSPYVAGRETGLWYKWKRDPLTADCVLMYAQRGSGKRSSYYSDYTFGCWTGSGELLPVGKAYFGFTDEELRWLDRFVRNHTVNRFGPVREVERSLVLEVAFDSIHRSTRHKSGLAMRFPRISRIRTDKPAHEADRIETLLAMATYKKSPPGLLRTGFLVPAQEKRLGQRLKVHRRIFAAPVDLDVELEPVAFVDRRQAGALNRRDMDERIRLAVIAADEAETLHRIEEFDGALGLFAGQLALRPAAEAAALASAAFARRRRAYDFHRLALDLEVGRRDAPAAIDQRELQRLAIGQVGQAGLLDRRNVDEHVLAAIIADDEAEALLRIEEFDDALAFANDLGRHSAASAAPPRKPPPPPPPRKPPPPPPPPKPPPPPR